MVDCGFVLPIFNFSYTCEFFFTEKSFIKVGGTFVSNSMSDKKRGLLG